MRFPRPVSRRFAVAHVLLPLFVACSTADGGHTMSAAEPAVPGQPSPSSPAPSPGTFTDPGSVVPGAVVPREDAALFSALRKSADDASKLDAAGARAAFAVAFQNELGYDPNGAQFLDRIQASALALDDAERAALGKNGFVISTRREFPTFTRGLAEIYSEHLPVYVSADALLESVHSSFDEILAAVEQSLIVPELRALLTGMRARLPTLDTSAETQKDLDLYLAVALGLLDGAPPSVVAGASRDELGKLLGLAGAAAGAQSVSLFGVARDEDFSQFTPRGHYADSDVMKQYFRAMIWLGRVDFRIMETQPNGAQLFRPSQWQASLATYDLVQADLARFERIDAPLRTLIGKSDYMVVGELGQLITDLGGLAAARTAADAVVVQAIADGGYGKQEIASHLIVNDTGGTLPLNRSFALLGQRYVVDAHVFSEVVYDRVADRFMPSPLDAAFAALKNSQALSLIPDVDTVPELPGALSRMRVLIDAHSDGFWDESFYNLWLKALRALSPASDLASTPGLPAVARSEPWGRRVLNAQLGSWAELRHDTLLYAKQSYTGIPGCAFPDAYVDPYPAFYAALSTYADKGQVLAGFVVGDAQLAPRISAYFAALKGAASKLGEMAERELRGEPFSAEQLAFINDAVRIETESVICSTIEVPNGWLAELYFTRSKAIEFDPTIADVHTNPQQDGTGGVLHVGTGYPRLMVTTVDTCEGPRAYAGVVFAYHELVAANFERLADADWAQRFSGASSNRPKEVSFMEPVLAR